MSLEFMLTTLVIVATPGTGVLYTLAAGLGRGAKASIVAAIACTLGIVPHLVAAISGLAAVLHASALAFEIIRCLGVAYLLYMAWTTLRDTSVLSVAPAGTAPTVRRVLVDGVLLNVLNPKLSIFFFAFLPQFVPAGSAGATLEMLKLGGVLMLVTLLVFVVYGLCAAAMRDHVIARPSVMTWMRRSFAAVFALLAARLALGER